MTRGTAVTHVGGIGADGAPASPQEPPFALSVGVLTDTVLASGNRVDLALNGDGSFLRLWNDLRSVREAITVQMYYGVGGQVADTLRDIPVEREDGGCAHR